MSIGVQRQPVLVDVFAPTRLPLWGSYVQRQYRKWTTFHSKSSTIKGLLYASDPHNCKKGTLSDQPRLSRVSSMVLQHCWGCSCSKMWCPLWLTLKCMPHGRGMLMIPLQSICSEEGWHYRLSKAQGSCQKTSNNQAIYKFGYALRIPYPGCTV